MTRAWACAMVMFHELCLSLRRRHVRVLQARPDQESCCGLVGKCVETPPIQLQDATQDVMLCLERVLDGSGMSKAQKNAFSAHPLV